MDLFENKREIFFSFKLNSGKKKYLYTLKRNQKKSFLFMNISTPFLQSHKKLLFFSKKKKTVQQLFAKKEKTQNKNPPLQVHKMKMGSFTQKRQIFFFQ